MTTADSDLQYPDQELAVVGEFLRQSSPFDQLDAPLLLQAVAALTIVYHPRGDSLRAGGPEPGLRILRSGALDLRDSDNKLLDRLGEGESFHIDGLNAERGEVQATVIEDALIYRLPDDVYRAIREQDRRFDRYFSSQRSRRLRRAARYDPSPNNMLRQVRDVMSTALLTAAPDSSILEVAQRMTDRRVSSAFILDGDRLVGIVTDRDLRQRVVARGLPATARVASIMTRDPLSIDAAESLFETTLFMTRSGIHHLPVIDDERLAGVVTTSDLILARQDDPVYLVQHITRQADVGGIASLLESMPNLMVQWVQSGVRAQQVSRILTAISDAVTVRLLQLAERELGPPPVPYCWCGFGSQARAEQLLGPDQDNGLIIHDDFEEQHAGWFEALAHKVCDGLNACGYVYCPGDVMATNPSWRLPLAQWQDTVRRWSVAPTPDAVMRVSIFFDLRAIHGDASLCQALQATMLEQTGRNTIFQAALAANALDSKPPLGIFRRFVVEHDGEHRDQLDLKKRGVLPVTEIVRLHALAHGITAVNTDERLQALAAQKTLTLEDSRNLTDALHFIQQLRIRHQCDQVERGETVTNYLNPRDLPKLAKEQLRDAFTIIDGAQSAVRQRYRAGLG